MLFGDTLRVRLAGDVSSGQQHLLAAAGIGFDKGYALIGLSQAREAVTGFDKQKLKAQGLLTEAAWGVPAARVLRAFVNARLDKASDRHLSTTVAQDTAVTVQDLLQVIQSGNTTLGFLPAYPAYSPDWMTLSFQFALFAAATAVLFLGPGAASLDAAIFGGGPGGGGPSPMRKAKPIDDD